MKVTQNKLLTIPTEALKVLAGLASVERRPLKNYMENILIDHAKNAKNGIERTAGVKRK
jgi:hypothetical protein